MEDDFTKYLTAASKKIAGSQKNPLDVKDSIIDVEQKISKLQTQIHSRGILLNHIKVYYKTVDNLICQIDEISKAIDETYQRNKEISVNSQASSTFFARESKLCVGSNQVPGLESPCMRNVREVCETISSHFTREYYQNAGLSDEFTSGEENSKEHMWSLVEDISHNFGPKHIQEALLLNIQESTTNLKDLCSRIDLKKDAKNLKFMFETGKLKDISTKPMLVQTVQQLMEEGQVMHFQRFLASEKAKNTTWKLEKKLQSLNESINQKISQKFDSEKAEQVREVFSLEQENLSYSASLTYLQDELIKLRTERQEKEQSVSILMKKYNRIQNFDKTVQGKQTVIQQLIKNNGSSKGRHRQQHQDIVTTAEQKIVKCQSELPDICHRFQEVRQEEIEKYLDTPACNLETVRSVTDKRMLVSELSINRMASKYSQSGEEHLKQISENFNVPSHAPVESILPAIIDTKNEVHRHDALVNENLKGIEEISKSIAKMSEIQEVISRSHEEDINASLPSLRDSQRKSNDIMAESMKFRKAVQLWWDQPAQHCVPWVKEEGCNISQHLDQFTSNVSLLKKLHLVNTQE